MRRVQARWACRNAAEFVRFAIEFSDMVKEEAVPEGEAPVEEEHEGGDTVGVRRVHACQYVLETALVGLRADSHVRSSASPVELRQPQ